MTTKNSLGLVRVANLFNNVALFFIAIGWMVPILAVAVHILILLANNFGYGGDPIFDDWQKAGSLLIAFLIFLPMYLFFKRLGKIIDSATGRDVFSIDNANNLQAMAWLLLVSQAVITLATAWNFTWIESSNEDALWENSIELALTFPYYLMVAVLFILAGVFRHGAAMREDLEGTV
jgi:hypothetical protein